jgi:serine phosphatase RsbU (regulator of sigma subunit)/pSer/pThr/pTyr-binding forkhead associated (FHA) protein
MASLLLLTGARQGSSLPLNLDRMVLGRDAGCDIIINETMIRRSTPGRADSISRKHAIILRKEGRYYIEDGDGRGNKSRNGTYVNDQRVPYPGRVPLQSNDRIRLCDFSCVFQEEPETGVSVEAAIDHESSVHSLETQPAERLKAILEISNSLSNTLEIDLLLPRIVESLFQLFKQADRGFILLRDEVTAQPVVRIFRTREGKDDVDSRFSTTIVRQCVENVQAILGNDLAQQFPDNQSINTLPIRSLMCAPLWSPDRRALGAIQLDSMGPTKKFTQDDLNLLLGVASQASIALCNARYHRDSLIHQRREDDLEVAHHVQRALLPQGLPEVPGYEFYAFYESAQQIGGDYYDFITLPGGRLAILLGDVAGKGVAGALVMVKFSVEARFCLQAEKDLSAAVTKLDAVMTRAALADRFVTLAAVMLDPASHTATLVNAGHPSPLLARHATGAVETAAPMDMAGPPIGLGGCDYASCQIQLGPGDGLVLFSDGITDAINAEDHMFRPRGVRAVLAERPFAPRETGERLIAAVMRHAAEASQNDDITLVCFGRKRG